MAIQEHTTRRGFLAGVATTVPAAAAIAAPLSVSSSRYETDPIFALLERERAAYRAFERSGGYTDDGDLCVEAGGVWDDAEAALYETQPTTVAGFLALFDRFVEAEGVFIDEPIQDRLNSLRDSARALLTRQA